MNRDNQKFNIYTLILIIALLAVFFNAIVANKAYAGKKTPDKKVIIIGFDGMDPRLAEKLMDEGKMSNLDKLRKSGGYKPLATSNPPQSPVAWASFINGAGPGTHGIFDFIHRNPEKQCAPFYSASETVEGQGAWDIGDHRLQLTFWPFNHSPTQTLLRREGVPFWDYLDKVGINSAFYNLPANYPPSASSHGNHCCLSGMGTPDMVGIGTHGTYQHYAEDGPLRTKDEGGGKRSMIFFENETSDSKLKLIGPVNSMLKNPEPATIEFVVHRDEKARATVMEIQKHKIILKEGQWSKWIQLDFELTTPKFMPNKDVSGICRFYLQEVGPNFRLYVTPINIDPSNPAVQITEPKKFIKKISSKLGLFYTTGFQEDHKAIANNVFTDAEYEVQTEMVLQERLNMLEYALDRYEDGLLFFYFSSTDLQAHMYWWNSDEKHPTRSDAEAKKYFGHLKNLYQRMDGVVGDVIKRYGDEALIIVMSDHGFCNFKRQFNLNTWLRDNSYMQPADCTSVLKDVDWSKTKAYSLGLNGIYLNLKGRERDGIVEPQQREKLLNELIDKLKAIRDTDGKAVIRNVYRTDEVYSGPKTYLAPDLLVGFYRGYRASWATTLGSIEDEVIADNTSTWSADHCIDPLEVPGVVFSNRPILAKHPDIIDIAPTVLTEFELEVPAKMTGKNIYIKR